MVAALAEKINPLQQDVSLVDERLCGLTALKALQELLLCTKSNRINPTIPQIVETVGRAVASGAALPLFFCQQLSTSTVFRRGKTEHQLWHGECHDYAGAFVQSADCEPWRNLKAMLQKISIPVELTILVDDLDILGTQGGAEWCQGNARERLRTELHACGTKLARAAEKYFRNPDVQVRCVSDFVSLDAYYSERETAGNFNRWDIDDRYGVIESSLEISCARGLPTKTCQQLACNELVSAAAHHRLLAAAVGSERGLLLWNTSTEPNPMWPVVLSNYNGAGYVASVAV